jgi:hypothetical protein
VFIDSRSQEQQRLNDSAGVPHAQHQSEREQDDRSDPELEHLLVGIQPRESIEHEQNTCA